MEKKEMTLKKVRAVARERKNVTQISAILCDKFSWHAYSRKMPKVRRSRGVDRSVRLATDVGLMPWTHRHTYCALFHFIYDQLRVKSVVKVAVSTIFNRGFVSSSKRNL